MARPLRIVFLDSWRTAPHDGSGTAVGIASLAEALRILGHEVAVLRPKTDSGSFSSRILFNLRLPGRFRDRPVPDLVVGFDLDGLFLRFGSALPRYVVALKGVAWDEARFARSASERRLLRTLGRLERRNARRADRVIVPSEYSAGVVQREYCIPGNRIGVVPEPIDLAPFDRLRMADRAPREPATILSVARQYPRKDTATLLRALPDVRRAVPGARLRIVGGGPELPELRALASTLGLGDAVQFEGAVPDDDAVRRAFFEADVFCLPSRQEGFGIAFLEAMAAGLPVVAARAGAVPELVQDGETGLLVPPGKPGALSETLVLLLQDRELGARLGRAGLRRAREYDLESVGRAFVAESGVQR